MNPEPMMNRFLLFVLISGMFGFASAQSITSVSPDSVFRGQTYVLTITGQGTGFSQMTQGTQGTGTSWITRGVNAIFPVLNSVQSSTVLESAYDIPGTTAIGFWDLHVMATTGELVLSDGVFIDAATNNDPLAPAIRSSIVVFPNPIATGSVSDHFNIAYTLAAKSDVEIQLLDLNGRLLYSLEKGYKGPGEHQARFDLPGLPLRQSTFLVVLRVNDMAFATKVALIK